MAVKLSSSLATQLPSQFYSSHIQSFTYIRLYIYNTRALLRRVSVHSTQCSRSRVEDILEEYAKMREKGARRQFPDV